eukprot:m51a1_g6764 hypothetical protein (206) ;mRNA; f:98503-99215
MSLLAAGDASEFEGAARVRQHETSGSKRRARGRGDDDDDASRSAPEQKPKSGWGNDAGPAVPASAGYDSGRAEASDRDKVGETVDEADAAERGLEEDEDLVREVAAPPRFAQRPIATIRELDKGLQFTLPPAPDAGIDLSLLTSQLRPPVTVVEADVTWDFESLFQRVSTEIIAEQEEAERLQELKEQEESEQRAHLGKQGNSRF